MSSTKFHIAIVGGGIGGLVCALALSKYPDIHVELYEGAEQFREVGAGIAVWPRPKQILQDLGLKDLWPPQMNIPSNKDKNGFQSRKADQPEGEIIGRHGAEVPVFPMHRAALQNALVKCLKESPNSPQLHFSKRLVSYATSPTDPDCVVLSFADGTTATCDVLVGADGLHSATRANMVFAAAQDVSDPEKEKLLSYAKPVWTGTLSYRAVVPAAELIEKRPDHRMLSSGWNYIGKNGHIIANTISLGPNKLLNIAAFHTDPEKEGTVFDGKLAEVADGRELKDHFAGWEQEVQDLLDCVDKPLRWAINMVNGMPFCTHSRVVLLGDAGHAMPPHLAYGAGLAIEDAYVLATLLGHESTTKETITRALLVYQSVRVPIANDALARSIQNGKLYDFLDPRFEDLAQSHEAAATDRGRWDEYVKAINDNFEWVWTTGSVKVEEEAIKLLTTSSAE